jgi:hypothetical protein
MKEDTKPHIITYSCKNQRMTKFDINKQTIPYCGDETCPDCNGWKKLGEDMMEIQNNWIFGKTKEK